MKKLKDKNYNEDKLKDFIDYEKVDKKQVLSYLHKDENEKETFDVNGFAVYLQTLIKLLRCENDNRIYIYRVKGFYQPLQNWYLPAMLKEIFTRCGKLSLCKYERSIILSLERNCKDTVKEFNSSNCVNLKNGVLNLDEDILYPHTPLNSMFDYILDYEYNKKSKCPEFLKFIKVTCCKNKNLIKVLQEIMGYCLSTRTNAEKAFFFYGGGCNGKSVLANVIYHLVGQEQSCAVSLESIKGDFAMSAFINKKVNIASENESMPSTEKLKTLISCDRINIPRKYLSDWTGKLFTKHIFLMNSLPNTSDITYGFFRKIIIIPFNHIVSPKEIDRDLTVKLMAEMPGILNWAFEGYKRLIENDYVFTECKAVNRIMKEYMDNENPTAVFFNDTYEKAPESKILKSDLYRDYIEWCNQTGAKPMIRKNFLNALELKANEDDSNILLDFRRRQGYVYLIGYQRKNDSSTSLILTA